MHNQTHNNNNNNNDNNNNSRASAENNRRKAAAPQTKAAAEQGSSSSSRTALGKEDSTGRRTAVKTKVVRIPQPLPLRFQAGLALPGGPAPRSFPSREAYVKYFEQSVVCEMQTRLAALATAWRAGGAPAAPPEVSVVVRGAMIGAAAGGPAGTAALLFGRQVAVVKGSLKACAKNDLWIVLLPGQNVEPLLLRSLWKGVTPTGRLLCAAANSAASDWLQTQQGAGSSGNGRLLPVTAIASGAFAGELVQTDALRFFAGSSEDSEVELS
ncbi:unnamed protein product, partial [Polarella glacialis]